MMTKFNVGDKVRIISTDGACLSGYSVGNIATVYSMNHVGTCKTRLQHDGNGIRGFGDYGVHFELVAPKKSERITALETQVAELQAKVEALEKAVQFPNTARFERESAVESEAMDGILADIKRKARTPNEQRADVIKRAKAFIEDIVGERTNFTWDIGGYKNQAVRASFHVNTEKGAVTALIHGNYSRHLYAKGIAKCDPDDVFNADIGKAIALARALGVDVPTEFVKAVQPTASVGQRIRLKHCGFTTAEAHHLSQIDSQVASGIAWISDDTDAVYE